ncbi:S26 family signal peptidase, partial [Streptococcus gordonii]|uniref:S26 family signal peptidase n=1 Tax=Streptococcus gordonii TaxID=1302 RepID=UPI001D06A348
AKLQIGDIVTFQDDGVTITHSIVEVIQENESIGYRTKGDNPANSVDPYILTPDRIQAVYVMKLPFRFTSES